MDYWISILRMRRLHALVSHTSTADTCQLRAALEDCWFERNEAQRLLKVGVTQIRDEEIKRLTVWMEKNRVVTPRTLGGNREIAGNSGRGKEVGLTFIGK